MRTTQMNNWRNHQFFYVIGFLIVGILLAGAQYLQIYRGVNPCPLCLIQRFVFGLLGMLFVIGIPLSFYRLGQVLIGLLSILLSITGIVFAGRQVWLQTLHTEAGANCEVSLQYMINVLPIKEIIEKVFQGGSGCSQISWSLLGLSLAQWSFAFFILFLFFSIWQLRRLR